MAGFDAYKHFGISLNPDGTLTRLMDIPTSDPNPDETSREAVVSKDVSLDDGKGTWVRVYRPIETVPSGPEQPDHVKIPILLYLHGGYWINCSAKDTITHNFCNRISVTLNCITVSVNYRLAPEHRLPAQYDDAMDAIQWIRQQATDPAGEPWIHEYGDILRCYIYGSGNGGNIAFFSSLRVVGMDLEPMRIVGLIMNQPMFGGNMRTESEMNFAADQLLPLPGLDLLWELTLPKGTDRDHRYCNPLVDGTHKDKLRSLCRCLVIGFGMDPMIDRQQDFATMLALNGVCVEARFDDVGFHGIDLVDPQRMEIVIEIIKDFIIRSLC